MIFVALRPVLSKRVEAWTVWLKRVDFWRVPDKAPRVEGGRGEETSPLPFKMF